MLGNLTLRLKQAVRPHSRDTYAAAAHESWRMRLLFAIALCKLLSFFGGNWDIQWHVAIGRDSLFIPPHMMLLASFGSGLILILYGILTESTLARQRVELPHTVAFGVFRAPPAFWGVLLGYSGALVSGLFDELWHRTFGIDATLWSPPHLGIMACTLLVDLSLMLGLAASARRQGAGFQWKSPLLWALALTGAYTFESVNFQMSQAFIEGLRHQGVGLWGILFPVLVGAAFPLPLLLNIRLAGRFWVAGLIFLVAITFQLIGTGVAAAGFAILQPVSQIEDYIRQNPDSSISLARELASRIGFTGLIGLQQAWGLTLSAVPLALVSLLDLVAWARRRIWIAAPVYSVSLVVVSWLWFRVVPFLRDYPTTGTDVALGVLIGTTIGLALGRVGLALGQWNEAAERR